MKIAIWNIRGFNQALKQNGVLDLIRRNNLDIIGILETKINSDKLDRIMRNKFNGWREVNNFQQHRAGRILVLWNPAVIDLHLVDLSPQAIHCLVTSKVNASSLSISFIYAFHTVVSRVPLWDNLNTYGSTLHQPWVILGDFNNVMKCEEKINGADVTSYEVKGLVDCCLSLGLTDLNSVGCFYTWTNNTIWSKLDRAMVNNQWFNSGINGLANFLPAGCLSDHSPCIVTIFQHERGGRVPFKFFNMWASHESYHSTVQNAWRQDVYGTMQYKLHKKLQGLKEPLKHLNQRHFGHISARAEAANNLLKLKQMELHNQPGNTELQVTVSDLRKKAFFLSEAERSFFSQRAKCQYIINSDRGTKFFHALVKRNSRKNHIAVIRAEDGALTSSYQQVADEFVRFFQKLYGASENCASVDLGVIRTGPILSSDQSAQLINNVSDVEIKDALFNIADDKAPGPDGFSSYFFKQSWDTVGEQFKGAVKEFFSNASILKQFNHTVIALVPKSTHSPTVGDFRPIACCNVFYKVLSKILASRLARVLESLVDTAQSAFVGGRNISDNIHMAQELLRQYGRKRISPRCLIKVDLCKAYDSVNWQFLKSVLVGMGFPSLFIQWVMECVTSTSFSVSVNGSLHGFIRGRKGLRQGDPLSPFLFVLCLEYFSRTIKSATENGSDFNFHPKCGKLRITHLAFADDLLLFSRGDLPSVQILMNCLHKFGEVSGLKVNELKSSLFTAGIVGPDLEHIQQMTNFTTGAMPFRYLGIPLAAEKLKSMHFAPFVDKIASYINAWTRCSLSYAGRAELIRAVLQGVECFWLSILPIPAAVIDRITRLCRAFLWGSRNSLVAWRDICLPKHEGGLGFRDTKAWNSALLARTLWNIHAKKDTLWSRWVNNIYLNGTSIWDCVPRKGDSPLIKKLIIIRNQLIETGGSKETAVRNFNEWQHVGTFSTAPAYEFFRPKGQTKVWAKEIWRNSLTPKHSFIVWLCAKSRILTKDRIKYLETDGICTLCERDYETAQHLFFGCPFTSEIWKQIRGWLGIDRSMSTIHSALKWFKKDHRGNSWQNTAKKSAFACTVYQIWNARNRRIFENEPALADAIICKVKMHVYKAIFAKYPYVLDHYVAPHSRVL